MTLRIRWKLTFLAVFLTALVGQPGRSDPVKSPALEIVPDSGEKLSLSAADLAKLPQNELVAKDHRGEEAKYTGVLLADVLKSAGVSLGEKLRGRLLMNVVIVEAADKYSVAFSLPEVDPEWSHAVVLIATSRNGGPLDAQHGPFQIVSSADKRHSRWVKNVARLTVRDASK